SQDVEADVIAIVCHTGLRSLDRPASPGFRFSINSCFITVPQLYVRVLDKDRQSGEKLLAQFLILTVGPRLGHFKPVAFLMQETQHRVVGAFHLILAGNMAMEGRCGPKGSLGAAGFFELFENLLFLRTRDERLPSCPLFRDQTVNAVQVERSDDLLYRTF